MKLWGGRFGSATDPRMEEFGRSLASDRRLAPYDVRACLAHVTMLSEGGVIPGADSARLVETLKAMLRELEAGELVVEGDHEDVHSWVEAELRGRLGELSSMIRIGRSRNDLVVTDFRLWMLDEIVGLRRSFQNLQRALIHLAELHREVHLPGYTHLQRAQPVMLAHHLLAHFWSFQRDLRRLERCREEADCCSLGAGALAGSSWPVRPQRTAELLGFSRSFSNSLDAVSDRDFAVEFLSAASIAAIHLSRLAEEIVLWTSREFGFAELSDRWATGSSLMPQKKNPDPAELVRGRSGRVVGALMSLLTTLKGLPLAYNRDLQEDKPPVFEAADMLRACLDVMAGALEEIRFHPQAMNAACEDPGLLATDLADALVRGGIPFSRAHELAGRSLAGTLTPEEQALVEPLRRNLDVAAALGARAHAGAAGPEPVALQLEEARRLLAQD